VSQDNFFEYGIAIDNGTPTRANVGQVVNFTQNGLAHGNHTVTVVDVPPACTGTAARTVALQGNDTATVAFNIQCPRTTGDVRLNVTTTGSDLDTDYVLTLNGSPGPVIPANGSVTYTGFPPGTFTFGLLDVETNCAAPPDQQATVVVGQLTTISFAITCAPVAVLRFVSTVTGADRDPDGLLVTVDNVASRIDAGATTHVRIPIGTRTYTTSDLQPNCNATGATTGTHTVAAGDTVTINLALSCAAIAAGAAGTATLVEAAGDTTARPAGAPGGYDILGMKVRYAPGFMILAFRFHKNVLSPATDDIAALYGILEFDVDENASTGGQPFINSFGGNSTQGVDYAADFFLTDTASVQLIRTPGGDIGFDAGLVRVRYDADSLVMFVPLSKLGNDDGKMTVTMVFGTGDRPTDIAPNTGQGTVQPPTPLLAARAGTSGRVVLGQTRIVLPKPGTWKRNR
jgi:hypothetical protein